MTYDGMVSVRDATDEAQTRTKTTRILIVEDDPGIQWVVTAFLEHEGYAVDVASHGAEALQRVEEQRPDLVLLDMNLPVVDGRTFVQHLRARCIEIPIVAVTAARHAAEWAKEIGAVTYISKPISLPLLIRRIDEIAA